MTTHLAPAASTDRCPRPADGVSLVIGKQRVRLVDPQGRTLHVLNGTALALWELCDGETTVDEMVEAACALFDGDEQTVRLDIEATVDRFTSAGLLTWEAVPYDTDERTGPG